MADDFGLYYHNGIALRKKVTQPSPVALKVTLHLLLYSAWVFLRIWGVLIRLENFHSNSPRTWLLKIILNCVSKSKTAP